MIAVMMRMIVMIAVMMRMVEMIELCKHVLMKFMQMRVIKS